MGDVLCNLLSMSSFLNVVARHIRRNKSILCCHENVVHPLLCFTLLVRIKYMLCDIKHISITVVATTIVRRFLGWG